MRECVRERERDLENGIAVKVSTKRRRLKKLALHSSLVELGCRTNGLVDFAILVLVPSDRGAGVGNGIAVVGVVAALAAGGDCNGDGDPAVVVVIRVADCVAGASPNT